jgi:hypothetical protein
MSMQGVGGAWLNTTRQVTFGVGVADVSNRLTVKQHEMSSCTPPTFQYNNYVECTLCVLSGVIHEQNTTRFTFKGI